MLLASLCLGASWLRVMLLAWRRHTRAHHPHTHAARAAQDKVIRPNGAAKNIGVLKPGGFADIAAQDTFCGQPPDCVIANVYDQSPQGNHLGQRHQLVNASQHKITVGPDRLQVYGMHFDPGFGYHVDNTTGIAKGNEPESMYAVMSGTHNNGRCCFE